jgi:hypothetical protein
MKRFNLIVCVSVIALSAILPSNLFAAGPLTESASGQSPQVVAFVIDQCPDARFKIAEGKVQQEWKIVDHQIATDKSGRRIPEKLIFDKSVIVGTISGEAGLSAQVTARIDGSRSVAKKAFHGNASIEIIIKDSAEVPAESIKFLDDKTLLAVIPNNNQYKITCTSVSLVKTK